MKFIKNIKNLIWLIVQIYVVLTFFKGLQPILRQGNWAAKLVKILELVQNYIKKFV